MTNKIKNNKFLKIAYNSIWHSAGYQALIFTHVLIIFNIFRTVDLDFDTVRILNKFLYAYLYLELWFLPFSFYREYKKEVKK